jgi:ribosomal protein S18 acetylase RimI-like enzyme
VPLSFYVCYTYSPMPPPKLRAATPTDADALALVGAATFLETFAGILAGEHILEHCQNQHATERYATWLSDPQNAIAAIDLQGILVGYAVLTPPADLPIPLEPGDLELKRIYLLSRFQGSGLGRALIEWSQQQARARGARRLLLGVYAGNAGAIAFYRHLGFQDAGARSFHIGHGTYEDLVLAKSL